MLYNTKFGKKKRKKEVLPSGLILPSCLQNQSNCSAVTAHQKLSNHWVISWDAIWHNHINAPAKSTSRIMITFLICVFLHGYLVRFECFDILTAGSFPKLSSDSSPSKCKLVSYIQSCQTKNTLPAASFLTVHIFSAPYTPSVLWPKQSRVKSGDSSSFFTQSVL